MRACIKSFGDCLPTLYAGLFWPRRDDGIAGYSSSLRTCSDDWARAATAATCMQLEDVSHAQIVEYERSSSQTLLQSAASPEWVSHMQALAQIQDDMQYIAGYYISPRYVKAISLFFCKLGNRGTAVPSLHGRNTI